MYPLPDDGLTWMDVVDASNPARSIKVAAMHVRWRARRAGRHQAERMLRISPVENTHVEIKSNL